MSVWDLVHKIVEESDSVKEEYDYLFNRYEKAKTFFKNPDISKEEKKRFKPKFEKMIIRLKKLRRKMPNPDAPEIEELPKDIVEDIDLSLNKLKESIFDSYICEQEPIYNKQVIGLINKLEMITEDENDFDTIDDVVRGATVIEKKDGKIHLVDDPNAIPYKKPVDEPCYNCRGMVLWESESGNIVCETCHPPPGEKAVMRRIRVGAGNIMEI